MTKKELEDKCKALRAEVDKLHLENEELKKEAGKVEKAELTEAGVGGFFDKNTRQWNLVELKFNPETGDAEVSDVKNVGTDIAMFTYHLKEFVRKEITMRSVR